MPRSPYLHLLGSCAGLAITLCSVAVAGSAAFAAESSGLRGPLDTADATTTSGVKATAAATQQTRQAVQPAYKPISAGATPDDDTLRPTTQDDVFGDPASVPGSDEGTPKALPRRVRASAATPPDSKTTKAKSTVANPLSLRTSDETDADVGITRTGSIRDELDEDTDPTAKARREDSIEAIRRTRREDAPFAPVGIRAGSFILRPSVETGLTATDNVRASPFKDSGVLSESTLRLNAVSDWSRHSASLDAYGNYRKAISGPDFEETRIGVDARLNLDLADELRGIGTLGYLRTPEGYASPVIIIGTASEPIRQVYTGSAALEKDLGKGRFAITGLVEHDQYGDADLSTGGSLSQSDRNFTLATAVLRGGYTVSPAVTPFTEVEFGRRFYDDSFDSVGYERSANRYGARAGVALDIDEKIAGEIAAGYIREEFEDDRLRPIDGPSLSAALTWSPERETLVRLNASTTVESATLAGESGSILHSGTVTLEREMRANLTGTALLGAGYRDYTGIDAQDTLLNAEIGATWWLNRYAGITGKLRYERLESNIPNRDYDAAGIFAGIRVQR